MYAPSGLVVIVDPSVLGSSTFANRFRPQDKVFLNEEIAKSNPTAAEKILGIVVSTKLRARLPVVVFLSNLDAATSVNLLAIASRFNAPATMITTDNALSVNYQSTSGFSLIITQENFSGYLWGDLSYLEDKIDVVGDVHGQLKTLNRLVASLGYIGLLGTSSFRHPDNRLLVFVGDLIDKGPFPVEVLDVVQKSTALGQCLSVRGNHEHKLSKVLNRVCSKANTSVKALLAVEIKKSRPSRRKTLKSLANLVDTSNFNRLSKLREFLTAMPLLLTFGKIVVVHAAFSPELLEEPVEPRKRNQRERWLLNGPGRVINGVWEPTNWTAAYSGNSTVVHGHTSSACSKTVNNAGGMVISLDSGAGEGISLTACSFRASGEKFTTAEVEL